MTTAGIEPMWTIQDLAKYLGVPVKTIYDWRTRNYGPPARKIGRYIRYRAEEVRSWVDSIAVTTT